MDLLLDSTFWSTLESVLTVFAILVGGVWTFRLYRQKRQRFPRASVRHEVQAWPASGGCAILRCVLFIQNEGDVLIQVASGQMWVSALDPASTSVRSEIEARPKKLGYENRKVRWPALREAQWSDCPVEVEPGESDRLEFDFVIDRPVRLLQVYSHIQNVHKRGWLWSRRQVGWNTTTVHEVEMMETPERLPSEEKPSYFPPERRQGPPETFPDPRPQGPPEQYPGEEGGGDGGGGGTENGDD